MGTEFKFRRCRECGVPKLIGRVLDWKENGTIYARTGLSLRVYFINSDFQDKVFSKFENMIGLSIRHIAYEAERNLGRESFENALKKLPGMQLLKSSKFLRKFTATHLYPRLGALFGLAIPEILEYLPGEKAIYSVKNPFEPSLAAAVAGGAFEFLDGVPYDFELTEAKGHDPIMTLVKSERRPEISKRMDIDISEIKTGNVTYHRCPKCGVPVKISERFNWIENEGLIIDKRSGCRYTLSSPIIVNAVFREISKELGGDIDELIVKAQEEWTIENIDKLGLVPISESLEEDDIKRIGEKYLEDFPLLGYGNPVSHEVKESVFKVTIENPFGTYGIAGVLKGLYEALQASEAKVSWDSPRDNKITYTIKQV